jgi:hypothetical protein
MTNSSILMDAYWQSMKECDSPSDAAIGAMATSTSAFTFLAIYSIGVFLQLCILPANLRLAKHRSAFLLLLHIVRPQISIPKIQNNSRISST